MAILIYGYSELYYYHNNNSFPLFLKCKTISVLDHGNGNSYYSCYSGHNEMTMPGEWWLSNTLSSIVDLCLHRLKMSSYLMTQYWNISSSGKRNCLHGGEVSTMLLNFYLILYHCIFSHDGQCIMCICRSYPNQSSLCLSSKISYCEILSMQLLWEKCLIFTLIQFLNNELLSSSSINFWN